MLPLLVQCCIQEIWTHEETKPRKITLRAMTQSLNSTLTMIEKKKKKGKETQLNKSEWCNTVLNVVTFRTIKKYCFSTKFREKILVAQRLFLKSHVRVTVRPC